MEHVVVPLKKIVSKANSRMLVNPEEMSELMESIKTHGLLQPIGLRKSRRNRADVFEVVWGNRRLMAATKLGEKEIRAYIVPDDVTEKEALILNLTENVQRKDISVYEFGLFLSDLKDKYEMTVGELAVRLGLPKSRISAALETAHRIPSKWRHKIINVEGRKRAQKHRVGKIPASMATSILHYGKAARLDKEQMDEVYDMAAKDQLGALNVRQVTSLMGKGVDAKDALATMNKTHNLTLQVPMKASQHAKLKEGALPIGAQLLEILYANGIQKPF